MRAILSNLAKRSSPEAVKARARQLDEEESWPEATKLWLKLAESGDVDACHVLGERYESGIGALQNFVESEKWFRRAAEAGKLQSQAKLGEIYFHGRVSEQKSSQDAGGASSRGPLSFAFAKADVDTDFAEAFRWNEAAAKGGEPAAQVRLGFQFATGQGVSQDFEKAEKWFAQASSKGHDGGALGIGLLYAGGHGRPANLGHAVKWFTLSAERGNSSAMLSLGLLYMRGDGVAKDETKAAELFRKAAENGQVEAMYLLGEILRFGVASGDETGEAESWLRRAAVRGHVKAMTSLGRLLLEGPTPDPVGAAVYVREAAELRDLEAQVLLGEMYAEGRGLPRDERLAIRWLTEAAEAGSAIASERLGIFYALGVGVRRDALQAKQWFERAADSGDAVALYNLGVLEEDKSPLERDLRQAQKWYELAAQQGSGEACLRLGILAAGSSIEGDGLSAADWFLRGTELGNLDAMCNFGLLCVRGDAPGRSSTEGVDALTEAAQRGSLAAAWALHNLYAEGRFLERDDAKAAQWLNVAAEIGCEVAATRLAS